MAAGTGKARPLAKAPEPRNAVRLAGQPVQIGTILKALFTIRAAAR